MLTAIINGKLSDAWISERSESMICPECNERVILKRGRVKVAHFAHFSDRGCSYGAGETQSHMMAKTLLAMAFRLRGIKAEVEAPIMGPHGMNRADVMLNIRGQRVAVELQHSNIDLTELERRAWSYGSNGIAQIWISVAAGVSMDIERYPAKPFEKWMNGFHFGKLWLWDSARNAIVLGKLSPSRIYVEATDFGGGYEKNSKRWRKLSVLNVIRPDQLSVSIGRRSMSSFGGYTFPAGKIATFV